MSDSAVRRDAIKRVLHQASKLDADGRAAFLDEACRDDPALLAEIVSLLENHDRVTSIGDALHPRQIGPYRIVSVLGEGGMGTVYLAEEQHPIRRRVALKIVRHDLDTNELLARFERERQSLALMEHSGIARVFGAGTTRRGRPYFVMEYVPGTPITEYCDARSWSVGQRLELFARVCLAVHHAHQKGVIHRDIKPSNVLVADGDEGAISKVIDFGVARAAAGMDAVEAGRTSAGMLVGTMEHMSPEQATPEASNVDTRSDVYALGVLLYELLTGRRPFELGRRELGALAELQRRILEEPARAPSAAVTADGAALRRSTSPRGLARAIAGDLDWIVLKAIEKNPARRYASASELAADVQRFLRGEPVLAGPPSLGYRTRRFVTRHRTGVVAAGAIAVLAVVGLGFGFRQHQIASNRMADYRNLADRLLLNEYLGTAQELWPPWPEEIPAMERWLAAANTLANRADFHAARLESMRERAHVAPGEPAGAPRLADLLTVRDELRRQALAETDPSADPTFVELKLHQAEEQIEALRAQGTTARRYVFQAEEDQRLHDNLARLVDDLRALADPDPAVGAIAEMQARIARARTIERETLLEARPAWERAIASIADRAECPAYSGLVITPQTGLVPLRRNAQTGLWEFWVWGTGRGADGLVLVLVPGGTFAMGVNPGSDGLAWRNEGPVHEITLDPFFISKYEMTRGQWRRLTSSDPDLMTPPRAPTESELEQRRGDPVDQVYWQESHDVLARIGLELPTEAQWEYAARAGAGTRWSSGDDPRSVRGFANLRDAAARRAEARRVPLDHEPWLDDGYGGLAPVGSFRPNAFGLHDTMGNVAEWCRDWFQSYECPVRAGTGERIPVDAGPMRRVIRGGNRETLAAMARVTARVHVDPTTAAIGTGLRPSRGLHRRPDVARP